ncbi:MAG: phosphomannomutase/phosphoglucomutase [Deltaproteobacteria bacterium]|nr:phosphomannomutase/phosphoglucomutase [Deltaproteobacteria bacterium]
MSLSPEIFRQYDIRGVVDRDLTEEGVEAIGRAFATWVAKGPLVVGRDCRLHSERLAKALLAGISKAGVPAIDVGVVPTPTLYFALHHFDAAGGIQITGSHNPPEYNGLKISIGKQSLYGDGIQELRRRIETQTFPPAASASVERANIDAAYAEAVTSRMTMGPRHLKAVVDGGNGTAAPTAIPILEKLGVEVVPLFAEMDGTFPNHHPDPTVEQNLLDLRRAVLAEKADLGIAFDGDGDRIGVLDEEGRVLWGDQLMILFSRALLTEVPGATVIGEVKCSQTLYDEITRLGGKPVMWKAGHSLIKAKMAETGAELAGEMSGHIFFKHRWYGFDDATYSAARLVELLSREPRPLGELLLDVPKTHSTPELRADCPEDLKAPLVAACVRAFRERGMEVVDVDGARVSYGDGAWGLVRASNTTPILVLRFEAKSDQRLKEVRTDFEAVLEAQRAKLLHG